MVGLLQRRGSTRQCFRIVQSRAGADVANCCGARQAENAIYGVRYGSFIILFSTYII